MGALESDENSKLPQLEAVIKPHERETVQQLYKLRNERRHPSKLTTWLFHSHFRKQVNCDLFHPLFGNRRIIVVSE